MVDLDRAELEKQVAIFSGNPLFADLARLLRKENKDYEAMHVCLAGLSANPSAHTGRLLLARIYYERAYVPFALRELEFLKAALPKNKSIVKLIELISPSSKKENTLSPSKPVSAKSPEVVITPGKVVEDTLAEAEFDLEILSRLSNEDKDSQ